MKKTKKKTRKVVKAKQKAKKVDIKYLGIPNICFSLTAPNDTREVSFNKQRTERGFDDSETWALSNTIALFIIPRLKRYQEIANDFLRRDDKLVKDIDSFLKALELSVKHGNTILLTEEENKEMLDGFKKFPEIFMSLWW